MLGQYKWRCHESVMSIKFADMTQERVLSVMGYERSVITMTLLRLGYLVDNLGNCAMTLPLRLALYTHSME